MIKKILKMLQTQDYITPLSILNLTEVDQLVYMLREWFDIATTIKDTGSKNPFKPKKTYPQFDSWIKTVRYEPLPGRIRVVDIGFNSKTNNSVLPLNILTENLIQVSRCIMPWIS